MGNPIVDLPTLENSISQLRSCKRYRLDLEKHLLNVTFELRAARVNFENAPEEDSNMFEDIFIDKQALHSILVEKLYKLDQRILNLVETIRIS